MEVHSEGARGGMLRGEVGSLGEDRWIRDWGMWARSCAYAALSGEGKVQVPQVLRFGAEGGGWVGTVAACVADGGVGVEKTSFVWLTGLEGRLRIALGFWEGGARVCGFGLCALWSVVEMSLNGFVARSLWMRIGSGGCVLDIVRSGVGARLGKERCAGGKVGPSAGKEFVDVARLRPAVEILREEGVVSYGLEIVGVVIGAVEMLAFCRGVCGVGLMSAARGISMYVEGGAVWLYGGQMRDRRVEVGGVADEGMLIWRVLRASRRSVGAQGRELSGHWDGQRWRMYLCEGCSWSYRVRELRRVLSWLCGRLRCEWPGDYGRENYERAVCVVKQPEAISVNCRMELGSCKAPSRVWMLSVPLSRRNRGDIEVEQRCTVREDCAICTIEYTPLLALSPNSAL
ncbi:hypothetical protein Tco_0518136 [Tanacetum coccineum]